MRMVSKFLGVFSDLRWLLRRQLSCFVAPRTLRNAMAIIDTALASGEEFPRFREFWIERPNPDEKHLVIYALLDSPRATWDSPLPAESKRADLAFPHLP